MKGEAAAFSVRAQRCQTHYFSTTPRIFMCTATNVSTDKASATWNRPHWITSYTYFKIIAYDSYYLASYAVSFGKQFSTFPVTAVSSKRRVLLTRPLPQKVTASQVVKKFSVFKEPKGWLPSSQGPVTAFLNQTNPVHASQSHLLKIHFNIILPSTSGCSTWSLSLRYRYWNPVYLFPVSQESHMCPDMEDSCEYIE